MPSTADMTLAQAWKVLPHLYPGDVDLLDEKQPGYLWRAEPPIPGSAHGAYIEFVLYRIARETPKGYWIHARWMLGEKPRWRSKTGRFAHETRRDALMHLWSRKQSHVRHAKRRLEKAAGQLNAVERACSALDRFVVRGAK